MSIAKLEFSEFNKRLYNFCIDLLGMDGQVGYDYWEAIVEMVDHLQEHEFLPEDCREEVLEALRARGFNAALLD